MATQPILIKTWYYPICNYKQDTDPYDAAVQHHPDYFPQVPLGLCVPGWLVSVRDPRHHEQQMGLDLRPEHLNQTTANDAADIASIRVVERDDQDIPVLTDTGQEKTRELTPEEQQAKLDEANRAMDNLASQEFDPRQVG